MIRELTPWGAHLGARSGISCLGILMAGLMTAPARTQAPTNEPPPSPLPATLPGVPQSPGNYKLSQCGSGQLTVPANYIRASQIPPSWRVGQIVIGKLNFTTNGKSPEYKLGNGPESEVDEEHSIWCLTYGYSGTAYTLQTNARWWHQTTDIQPGFNNRNSRNIYYDTIITVTTRQWVGNAPSPGQPTLSIQNGGTTKHQYRSVAMSSGVSLPQIITKTGSIKYYLKGGKMGTVVDREITADTTDQHPTTAYLELDDWTWGRWDTPYSGEIATVNNYIDYHTKPIPGYTWLEVDAIWSTKPGPGQ